MTQVRVTQCGRGDLEITHEFFANREEAMAYYDIQETDQWFFDNYSIEEVETAND